MKRIAKDTAFTLWTAASGHRVIQRDSTRRTLEIMPPTGLGCDSYFVPGRPLHIIHPGMAGQNYQVS